MGGIFDAFKDGFAFWWGQVVNNVAFRPFVAFTSVGYTAIILAQRWWQWVYCMAEKKGLELAILLSREIVEAMPPGTEADDLVVIANALSNAEYYFPVSAFLSALVFYFGFYASVHFNRLVLEMIPFVK